MLRATTAVTTTAVAATAVTLAAMTLAAGLVLLARRRLLVVTVDGDSMRPALQPGDRVLALRRGPGHRLRPGRMVICRMPVVGVSEPPLIVKRVTGLPDGQVWVTGDGPGSYDSRTFGPLARRDVVAEVLLRLAHGPDPRSLLAPDPANRPEPTRTART